jgi:hypothetical protein
MELGEQVVAHEPLMSFIPGPALYDVELKCQAAFGAPSEEEAIRHAGVDQLIPKLRQRFD